MLFPVFLIIQILILAFLFTFFGYSVFENEIVAAKRIIPAIILFILVLILSVNEIVPEMLQIILIVLFLLISFLILLPFGNLKAEVQIPAEKFDERDIMFSRNELKPETEKFENYYNLHPENKPKDDLFRKEPGLLKKGTYFYNRFLFEAADATFSAVDLLHPLVEKTKNSENNEVVSSEEITSFIKNWAKSLGAHSIGFTSLQAHHIYSHIGRGKEYGKAVNLTHKYALAFTVEMKHHFVQSAPKGTIVMESAQQYLNSGQIAIQIAQFIRNLGFDARAHIDANYRVICPIIAQDAGLGTVGRMGLLMTPKLGPRVRIAVVTTDLELSVNVKKKDATVLQFCEICKKCANNCPSQAISFKSAKTMGEWNRWKLNHEKCFTYWTKAGTDCGKCIAVCPYSHPNNTLHNFVRWMVKRNTFNRWMVFHLDNLLYSKKPKSKPLKSWMISK